MLKTNSKKAVENIRAYITTNFTPENYTDQEFTTFSEIAAFIMENFRAEKFNDNMRLYYRNNETAAFTDCAPVSPHCLIPAIGTTDQPLTI